MKPNIKLFNLEKRLNNDFEKNKKYFYSNYHSMSVKRGLEAKKNLQQKVQQV